MLGFHLLRPCTAPQYALGAPHIRIMHIRYRYLVPSYSRPIVDSDHSNYTYVTRVLISCMSRDRTG